MRVCDERLTFLPIGQALRQCEVEVPTRKVHWRGVQRLREDHAVITDLYFDDVVDAVRLALFDFGFPDWSGS